MKRSHSYNSDLNYSYSDEPIKIAIIGAGRAGEFHVESLSINKQFKLMFIVDTDEDKANELSKKANCLFHNDLDMGVILKRTLVFSLSFHEFAD